MSEDIKSEFSGCGGGCACAANRAANRVTSPSAGQSTAIGAGFRQAHPTDVFSSVALASELLAQPEDDYVDNIRSLWSSLAPDNRIFAAGSKQWPPVNQMIEEWFVSGEATVEAARMRYDSHINQAVAGKIAEISNLLFTLAPMLARENYFASRGQRDEAQECARERSELVKNQLLPLLNFTADEESQIQDDWFRLALNWTREVASQTAQSIFHQV